MMNTVSKFGLSAVLATLIAPPPAFAKESGAPATGPAQMMQDQGMMGSGDIQGMMAMMQMMQQMAPMMEACTGMMQAMAAQPSTAAPLPEKG
jgi:hypothetical protein